YIQEYYIKFNYTHERVNHVLEQIHSTVQKNTDFKPLGYSYDTMLWATHFSKNFKILFNNISKYNLTQATMLISAAFFLVLLIQRLKPNKPWEQYHLLGSIWIVGFTEISLEIILILGFQILWGAAYKILALLIATYMLGLSLGSLYAWKIHQNRKASFHSFQWIQGTMTMFSLLCIGGILLCQQIQNNNLQFLIPFVFILLTLFAGSLGGFQFVLANHLYIKTQNNLAQKAGFLYGIDLFGSAFGALACSSLLIPILGILKCLLFLSILNGSVVLLMMFKKEV
ncbi:hypothetical protein ACFL4L_07915, partial [bacterium]